MENYFDPNGFLINIQNCIQALRTVTWLLQNKKHEIPDFDSWYGRWQERMKTSPVMRRLVNARNKIEKQGDLETHSQVHVEVIASYENALPVMQVKTTISETIQETVNRIPRYVFEHRIIENGAIKIQRRWVENTLPEHEILDALAYVYGQLSLLIDDAHRQLGLPVPKVVEAIHDGSMHLVAFDRDGNEGRLPCMVANDEHRTLHLSLKTLTPLHLETGRIYRDYSFAEKIKERYPHVEEARARLSASKSLEEYAQAQFQQAREVFIVDGYHLPFMHFLKNIKVVDLTTVAPANKSEKYLIMRQMASQVQRNGADAVTFVSEVWFALLNPEQPYQSLENRPDREEQLALFVASEQGKDFILTADIIRKDNTVSLGETRKHVSKAPDMLEPIREIWRQRARTK